MSDIVERLRACHGIQSGDPECCCEEAADEIERLKAELAEEREAWHGMSAEIERLRLLLREAWAVMPPCPFRERIGRALEGK